MQGSPGVSKMKKLIYIFIPIMLFWLSLTGTVRAYDGIFTLSHDGINNYFDYSMKPGDSGNLEFSLENTSDKTMENHFLIYDSLTAVNGGNIIMSPDNYTADETASWFSDNHMTITLEPGEKRKMSIGFSIPADCEDGTHTAIAGLFTYSGDSEEESEGVTLRIGSSYSSTLAVVIRLGKKTRGEFVLGDDISFDAKGMGGVPYILLPVENIGSAYGFPVVSYQIKDNMGNEVDKGTLEMDIFYRKTQSFAAVPAGPVAAEKGEYTIYAEVAGDIERGMDDSAEYILKMDSGTVREVFRKQVEKQMVQNGDFIILDKGELILAGGGMLGVAFISIILILVVRGRKSG